jgi:hypothetical protein
MFIDFTRQQLLRDYVSVLSYTHNVCHVPIYWHVRLPHTVQSLKQKLKGVLYTDTHPFLKCVILKISFHTGLCLHFLQIHICYS